MDEFDHLGLAWRSDSRGEEREVCASVDQIQPAVFSVRMGDQKALVPGLNRLFSACSNRDGDGAHGDLREGDRGEEESLPRGRVYWNRGGGESPTSVHVNTWSEILVAKISSEKCV